MKKINPATRTFMIVGAMFLAFIVIQGAITLGGYKYNQEYCRKYFNTENKAWIATGTGQQSCCYIMKEIDKDKNQYKCEKLTNYTMPGALTCLKTLIS